MNAPKIELTYNGSGTVYVFDKEQDKGFYCSQGEALTVSLSTALDLLSGASDWSKSGGVNDGE